METKFLIITFGTWFLFMILAIINAIVREGIFTSFLNELRAHQLSTLTLMILFFTGTYLILRYSEIQISDQQAFIMGCIWVIMTIIFEFVAGHYLFGNSWDKLLADYNILNGRIWILIPITALVSPYLANRLIHVFA
jgi:NhaP-type Na+/H+ and K+/H+ antiporter